MSLRGSLADLPLPDLVQIIAVNRKSGILRVATAQGDGMLVFRRGKVVYGATTAQRESLGSLLVLRGLVSAEQLQQALRRQAEAQEESRLGSVLVEMSALSATDLRDVLHAQLREVMAEMRLWTSGVVRFEEMEIAEHGDVTVDAQDFVTRDGLTASGILVTLVDERAGPAATPRDKFLVGLGWVWPRPESTTPVGEAQPARGSLSAIIRDLRMQLWSAEIFLGLLRATAQVASRGVLLLRAPDGFRGLSQFGVWPSEEAERVRTLRVPLSASSLLIDVARSKTSFRGRPSQQPHDLLFYRFLDCEPPPEVMVLPVAVDGEVQLLIYGDNLPQLAPLGPTEDLERLTREVSRAMATATFDRLSVDEP